MQDLIVLGTDTDVGKTTFSLLWLAIHHAKYDYWKPVETGPSDTETVQQFIADAECFEPACRFKQPVAPPLAAAMEGRTIPAVEEIVKAKPVPSSGKHLLIETFGGPFSPLTDDELQLELIRKLDAQPLLVSSSALGAIGRTLQCLEALRTNDVCPFSVVLLGEKDEYAMHQIEKHGEGLPVFSLAPPREFSRAGIQAAAQMQAGVLREIANASSQSSRSEVETCSNLIKKDRRLIWHPYTSLRDKDDPLVIDGATDEFLDLADGRKIIDGISSWWTILHGHRHPVLMDALWRASQEFDHVLFAGATHSYAVRLAELLLQSLPWQGGRVFYSDNGSTAVEVALKMAYQFWRHRGEPQRTLFIGFENGYHGDTFGAMAVGRDPLFFGGFEPLLFKAEMVPVCADRLNQVLHQHKGLIAAVIIEPLVQGAGGMRMHSPEELRAICEVARDHDVLFIVDEVMTGGGRLGSLWAHRLADINPDLISASKTLSGGVLPLAATLAAPHIAQAFDTADRTKTFFHGHSFTGHPLACAVAVANWEILTNQPPQAPQRMEAFWREKLLPLAERPNVKDVRIRGSIAAVELNVEGGYLADVGRELRRHCLDQGVLLRPLGNVLYAMPPFCASADSLARIAISMTNSVDNQCGAKP